MHKSGCHVGIVLVVIILRSWITKITIITGFAIVIETTDFALVEFHAAAHLHFVTLQPP